MLQEWKENQDIINKEKLEKCVASRPTLKKWLKEFSKDKGNIRERENSKQKCK